MGSQEGAPGTATWEAGQVHINAGVRRGRARRPRSLYEQQHIFHVRRQVALLAAPIVLLPGGRRQGGAAGELGGRSGLPKAGAAPHQANQAAPCPKEKTKQKHPTPSPALQRHMTRAGGLHRGNGGSRGGSRAWMTQKCRLGRKKETWKVRGLRMRRVDTTSSRTWGGPGGGGDPGVGDGSGRQGGEHGVGAAVDLQVGESCAHPQLHGACVCKDELHT